MSAAPSAVRHRDQTLEDEGFGDPDDSAVVEVTVEPVAGLHGPGRGARTHGIGGEPLSAVSVSVSVHRVGAGAGEEDPHRGYRSGKVGPPPWFRRGRALRLQPAIGRSKAFRCRAAARLPNR
jgi:hypothetical protein